MNCAEHLLADHSNISLVDAGVARRLFIEGLDIQFWRVLL